MNISHFDMCKLNKNREWREREGEREREREREKERAVGGDGLCLLMNIIN
jgi:hypothetical protein